MRKLWDMISPLVCLLLCMLCSTMAVTMVFGLLTGIHGLNNELLLELFPWLSLVITLAACVLTVAVLRKSLQLDAVRFGYDRREWKPWQYLAGAVSGAAAGHVWSCLIYISGLPGMFSGYEETASKAFAGQPLPLLILTTVIAAPIAEELVFRFMIYRRIRQYYGTAAGVLLSSILFGLYHANAVQCVYSVGFGLLLILLYEKSGSILAPILAHAGANLWAVVLAEVLPEAAKGESILLTAAEAAAAAVLILLLVKQSRREL